MLLDSHSLTTFPWSITVLEGSVGSQRTRGEEQTPRRSRQNEAPPALPRVWLSKKFSPHNQDPKKFAAMLLLPPWLSWATADHVAQQEQPAKPAFPCKECVRPRARSGGASRTFHTPTASLCPPAKPRAWLWVQLPPKAGRAHPLGWALMHIISRESDIWGFTSEIPDLGWGVNLDGSLLQYIHGIL